MSIHIYIMGSFSMPFELFYNLIRFELLLLSFRFCFLCFRQFSRVFFFFFCFVTVSLLYGDPGKLCMSHVNFSEDHKINCQCIISVVIFLLLLKKCGARFSIFWSAIGRQSLHTNTVHAQARAADQFRWFLFRWPQQHLNALELCQREDSIINNENYSNVSWMKWRW